MQFNNTLNSKISLMAAFGMLFSLSSCGSFQYVGYDEDGVYDDSRNDRVEYVEVEEVATTETSSNNYYKDYFKDKSEQYSAVSNNNDLIFTDIESYQSEEYVEQENDSTNVNYNYAGWGENNTDITINVYSRRNVGYYWWNRPFYSPWGYGAWSYYDPFFFDPYFYDPFFYRPYTHFGWNNWYGYGFHSPFYNYGYGYGHYHPYNGYGYYGRRSVAYNAGRRGTVNNNSLVSRRGNAITSRNYSSRSNRSSVNSAPRTSTRPRSTTTTTRPRVTPRTNNSVPRTSTKPRSTTTSRPRATTPRTNNSRPRATTPRTNNSRPRVAPRTNSRPRTNTTYSRPRSSSSSGSFSTSRSSSSSSSRSSGSRSSSSRRR